MPTVRVRLASLYIQMVSATCSERTPWVEKGPMGLTPWMQHLHGTQVSGRISLLKSKRLARLRMLVIFFCTAPRFQLSARPSLVHQDVAQTAWICKVSAVAAACRRQAVAPAVSARALA